MSHVEELLEPGERVVYSTRTSWTKPVRASRAGSRLCLAGAAMLLLSPLLGTVMGLVTGQDAVAGHPVVAAAPVLGILVLGLGSMFLVQSFTDWWLQECFVTNLRVLTVDQSSSAHRLPDPEGSRTVASKDGPLLTASIWLDTVTEVRAEQDLLGVWFGFATVLIEQGESLAELPLMRRPAEFCEAITTQRAPFQ